MVVTLLAVLSLLTAAATTAADSFSHGDQAVAPSVTRRVSLADLADTLPDLHARIVRLTSPDAHTCGGFLRFSGLDARETMSEFEQAIDCGRARAAENKPFWLGTGSYVVESWQVGGLLAGPDGVMQHFTYDDLVPTFRVAPCSRPTAALIPGLSIRITCGAPVAGEP